MGCAGCRSKYPGGVNRYSTPTPPPGVGGRFRVRPIGRIKLQRTPTPATDTSNSSVSESSVETIKTDSIVK